MSRVHRGRKLALTALLACSVWSAGAAAQTTLAIDPSLGVQGQMTSWFAGTAWHHLLEAAARLSLVDTVAGQDQAPPLALAAGVRGALTSAIRVPVEVFVRLELTGRMGRYREPSCGIETGWSGLAEPDLPAAGAPAGASRLQRERVSPIYVAFVATPLRFQISGVRLVAAEFRFGTTVAGSGALFSITYLRLEYRS